MDIFEQIWHKSWPWYVSGPMIGLIVALLLLLGNRSFGISTVFRHLCAATIPLRIPFFQYQWRKEVWNMVFVAGIFIGGFVGISMGVSKPDIAPNTLTALSALGIYDVSGFLPKQIFSWSNLSSWQGLVFTLGGGLLIGFGTRWAGGCTSGHSITGLATFQLPSLIATCCFLIGGFITTMLLLPLLF